MSDCFDVNNLLPSHLDSFITTPFRHKFNTNPESPQSPPKQRLFCCQQPFPFPTFASQYEFEALPIKFKLRFPVLQIQNTNKAVIVLLSITSAFPSFPVALTSPPTLIGSHNWTRITNLTTFQFATFYLCFL